MKISYAITVCNELNEIQRLLREWDESPENPAKDDEEIWFEQSFYNKYLLRWLKEKLV